MKIGFTKNYENYLIIFSDYNKFYVYNAGLDKSVNNILELYAKY
jgi:hypothetical protein